MATQKPNVTSNAVSGQNEGQMRLRACDGADLEVLAALLQDAILPGTDMQFDPASGRFIMVANRFCWERDPLEKVTNEAGGSVFERALCGVQIHHVTKVLQSGMPQDRGAALFNILTIRLIDDTASNAGGAGGADSGSQAIDIVFSGGSGVRLMVSEVEILAEDIEPARPSMVQPDHEDSTGSAK